MNQYRTRVYQLPVDKRWYVDYYMPYSGFLRAGPYAAWDGAWYEAEQIEEQKVWT